MAIGQMACDVRVQATPNAARVNRHSGEATRIQRCILTGTIALDRITVLVNQSTNRPVIAAEDRLILSHAPHGRNGPTGVRIVQFPVDALM